jgi:hypothetical protein
MAFESGPEWQEELFSAEYYLALIQCRSQVRSMTVIGNIFGRRATDIAWLLRLLNNEGT